MTPGPSVAHGVQPSDRAGVSAPHMQGSAGNSYRQVLRPTLVMGGSAVVGALLGIVRTKALALKGTRCLCSA